MQPFREETSRAPLAAGEAPQAAAVSWERLVGPVTGTREPQALFAEEDLEHALRQLVLFGRDGLPVLSHDGQHLRGWITRNDVLSVLGQRIAEATREIKRGALAAEFALEDPVAGLHDPPTPLRGYELVELAVGAGSPALGRRLGEIRWPPGCRVVAVTEGREIRAASDEMQLRPGERVILLAPQRAQQPAPAQSPALAE